VSLVQTVRSLLLTDFLSADPVAASICSGPEVFARLASR